MPYSKQKIINMVKEGVAEELNTELGHSGITPAQGAKAAVDAKRAIADLSAKVDALTAFVHDHFPSPPADGPAPNGGTRGRRAGTRTPTSPTT